MNSTFGIRLRSARQINGYTQEQFAELIGVTRNAVSQWETGITLPNSHRLLIISRVLQVSIQQLMSDLPKSPIPGLTDEDQ